MNKTTISPKRSEYLTPMDQNNPSQQPRNTPIIPLAQEIPQYRQAKLAGKSFLGPIRNVASKWSQVNTNLPILSDNISPMIKGQTTFPPNPVNSPIPVATHTTVSSTTNSNNFPPIQPDQLSQRGNQLIEKLKSKEQELASLRTKSAGQQQSLSTLSNQQKSTDALIMNLKQQLTNMQQNNIVGNEVEELKQKITNKEDETTNMRHEIERLQQNLAESDRIAKQIEVYQNQIKTLLNQQKFLQDAMSKSETELDQLKNRLQTETKEKETRESQIKKLEKLLEETARSSTTTVPQSVISADFNKAPSLPTMTKDPNAISGVVIDKAGKFIADSVVLIKNIAGQNLRALKTNQLGQFVVTTPLPNGKYFIQITKPGHSFDTVEINLIGITVPPVQIQSHELTT